MMEKRTKPMAEYNDDEAQGQSGMTPWKEVNFRSALQACERLSEGGGRFLKYPYWHIDLNSGCGVNKKVGCDGSPIEFLKVMIETKRYYRAIFCDRRKDYIDELKDRLELLGQPVPPNRIHFWRDNNDKAFDMIEKRIVDSDENPKYAVGSILSDPNGPSEKSWPIQQIAKFSRKFEKIDIIMNIDVQSLKRTRGVLLSGNNDWKRPKQVREKYRDTVSRRTANYLEDVIFLMHNRHWSVSEPVSDVRHCYVVMVGRKSSINIRTPRFYPIESSRGKEIVAYADSDSVDSRLENKERA